MSAEFNINNYWLERGRAYMDESRTPSDFHRLQEGFLVEVLKRSGLRMQRILEIGCGFGRVTRVLAETWPQADITGVDLSPDQLTHARSYCGNNPRLHFGRYDFYSGQPLPGGGYDVVLAIEVFLHHPPEFLIKLISRLAAAGRHLVNIDWSEDWPWPTPEHVWVHRFPRLYADAGLKCAAFPLPAKVDGKQQELFIAGEELPEGVRLLQDALKPALGTSPAAQVSDDWPQQVGLATAELLQLIPSGGAFILLDDGQWGNLRALAGHRVIRLLEKDGVYWGPPADDEAAWWACERWREAGASHLVFAWPSFWWIRHYHEFYRRVHGAYPCVLENTRLIVFDLQPSQFTSAPEPPRLRP